MCALTERATRLLKARRLRVAALKGRNQGTAELRLEGLWHHEDGCKARERARLRFGEFPQKVEDCRCGVWLRHRARDLQHPPVDVADDDRERRPVAWCRFRLEVMRDAETGGHLPLQIGKQVKGQGVFVQKGGVLLGRAVGNTEDHGLAFQRRKSSGKAL